MRASSLDEPVARRTVRKSSGAALMLVAKNATAMEHSAT